jgi:hypothetical protein
LVPAITPKHVLVRRRVQYYHAYTHYIRGKSAFEVKTNNRSPAEAIQDVELVAPISQGFWPWRVNKETRTFSSHPATASNVPEGCHDTDRIPAPGSGVGVNELRSWPARFSMYKRGCPYEYIGEVTFA